MLDNDRQLKWVGARSGALYKRHDVEERPHGLLHNEQLEFWRAAMVH